MQTVIFTGGASRRMGRDKATLETRDGPLSLSLARRYAPLGPVAFAVDRRGRFPCGGFPEWEDAFPGKGPFNGLYSAFLQTDCEYVFLTATDMPKGDPALARRLRGEIGEAEICTIHRRSGFVEPLFAVYHRRCFELVRHCLETDKLSLLELYERLRVRALTEEELADWDLAEVLFNINTPAEYARFVAEEREATGRCAESGGAGSACGGETV